MTAGELRRSLGVGDAVVIGAGSMIGAGVFAAWAPAARAAGNGLLIGLALAAIVAFCNATSSAQLAARHPESGGSYVYARHRLGPAWGHLAGWGFVVGKTASCAAMALTIGAYLWPEKARWVAIAAVLAITLVNIGGMSRTVAVTRILLIVSLATLAVVVAAGWAGDPDPGRLVPIETTPYGVLQSAGFLFFAFAGYARIATLGEEVREPERTIPRAIPLALAGVLVVYGIVAVTVLSAADAGAIGGSDAPLQLVTGSSWSRLIGVGAAVASLGVLLNLIPGVSRTTLAMARRRELPHWFAHVDEARSLPLRAELTVAAVVIAVVAFTDLRSSIALSGVAVLTYYALTNASALRLAPDERRWPRWIAVVGLIGCLTLIVALPITVVIIGSAVLLTGAIVRMLLTART